MYLIRPKFDERLNFTRDWDGLEGRGHDRPLRWICARWFTLFEQLPRGLDAAGDAYHQILEVADEADAKAKASALGFELRDGVLKPDELPRAPTLSAYEGREGDKPVKVSEYLRSETHEAIKPAEVDPPAEAIADAIDKSLASGPTGASFGTRDTEPEAVAEIEADLDEDEADKPAARGRSKKKTTRRARGGR